MNQTANRGTGMSGLNTGFNPLNKVTLGWDKGELVIISGRPGMGKSTFILSAIVKLAVSENTPIALFSLEQSKVQIANRLIAAHTNIPLEKIRNGYLQPDEWEKLDREIRDFFDLPLYIKAPARLSIEEFCETAREMVYKNGVEAIFLDYIQLLYITPAYSENRYNEINYISRELKALARELDIPIIVVSQMNRDIDKRHSYDGKIPVLTDLRDSGTLCDDADVVCFIHRPEYYKITEDERGNSLIGLAEVIIAKNRNGECSSIRIRFKKEIPKFMEVEEEIPEQDFTPPLGTDFLNYGSKEVPF